MGLWIVLVCNLMAIADMNIDPFEGVGEPPLDLPLSDESIITDRTDALAEILRCPVCQGMTVADSIEDASLAMKARIEELVRAGYSDEQILDYFIDRHGEGIVLLPDDRHFAVWFAPLLLILGGVSWIMVKQSRQDVRVNSEVQPNPDKQTSEAYRRQVIASLEDI